MSSVQTVPSAHVEGDSEFHSDVVYPDAIPFALVHLAALGVIFTGFTTTSVLLAIALYIIRMWGVTAGYHRYFSHRSFKTSRVGQFVIAAIAQSSAQRGALWWAAIHRHHHLHSDTPEDIHSPRHHGFWFSHVGWVFSGTKSKPDYSTISDLTKFPELVFLNRFHHLPALVLALVCLWIDGWSGLFVGFFLSTVFLYHGTFTINSLSHVSGSQRYLTGDDSRNNPVLALITLGEGWHNNHHHYQSCARQGFKWWEFDPTYYVLKLLALFGIVWDVREPPASVVRGENRVGRKAMEKVADSVVASFDVDAIARDLREAWAQLPGVDELRASLSQSAPIEELRASFDRAQLRFREWVSELDMPAVPTREAMHRRLQELFSHAGAADEVVDRAHEILLDRLAAAVLGQPSGLRAAS